MFAPGFVDHTAGAGAAPGIEGLRQFFATIQQGFPDFTVVVEDLFGEGDRVAVRFTFHGTHEGEFMGVPASGHRVAMPGIDIFRIEDGRIAELWGQEDMLGMLQQIGALPSDTPDTGA